MSKAAELANLIGNINAGGGGVNRNVIINGAMNVAQRNTSVTGAGDYSDATKIGYLTCDRWTIGGNNTNTRYTISQDSSAPSGTGLANSLKLACTTADTSAFASEEIVLTQKIEGQNVQGFCKGTSDAKPFAVSFYVKADSSATYVAELFDADNTRHVCSTFSVTTDWTRVEISFPADTTGAFNDDNGDSLYLNIWLQAGTDFTSGTLPSTWASKTNANRAVGISKFGSATSDTFFLTGVQIEIGQNPTEFESEPFETTFKKCQRYFQAWDNDGEPVGAGLFYGSNQILGHMPFRKTMRSAPSVTVSNVNWLRVYVPGSSANSNSTTSHLDNIKTEGARINVGVSGTSGHGMYSQIQGSYYAYLSAEL
tara:strand:- start:927 stop:2030 length:1104 start_codon:yes stop_codon:yes gene_type:complete